MYIISSKPARVSAAVPYGEKIELRELCRALEARPVTGSTKVKLNEKKHSILMEPREIFEQISLLRAIFLEKKRSILKESREMSQFLS